MEKSSDNKNSFRKENRIISRIDSVINDWANSDNPMFSEFEVLAREYKRQFKQMKKLLVISDKTQKDLFDTRAELKEKYDIIDEQLTHAAEYIRSLLPEKLDDELKICGEFIPSDKLGGDIYGYHEIDDDNLAIYIIDVCGHGVGPALYSVSVINTIKFQNLPGVDFTDPEDVVFSLNNAFQMSDHNNMFFTMWYCVYNKGKRKLSYCGAGHPPIIILNGHESVQLKSQNAMIGPMPNWGYVAESKVLDPGMTLYIYTDGAYEIEKKSGEMFEISEMIEFLKDNIDDESSELKKLYNFLIDKSADNCIDDDYTIIKICI